MRLALIAMVAVLAQAQTQPPEGVRQLWSTQFEQKRPPAKTPPAKPPKLPVYKPANEAVPQAAAASSSSAQDTLLGLTLWLLRPARPADDPNSRLLVLDDDDTSRGELVPVRIEADTPVNEGDRVRLTVEVPRTGYLYIFDREQYADGTTSAPYLIYPNYKTRPGDNSVSAGRVVEVPDQRDTPNHFRVRKSRPDQTAELISMMITPKPMEGLNIGRDPLKISEEQFQEWEKQYRVQAQRFEMEGGAGETYTKAEKEAGSADRTVLNQDDPYPQTLYKVPAETDKPLLLNVPVKITQKK